MLTVSPPDQRAAAYAIDFINRGIIPELKASIERTILADMKPGSSRDVTQYITGPYMVTYSISKDNGNTFWARHRITRCLNTGLENIGAGSFKEQPLEKDDLALFERDFSPRYLDNSPVNGLYTSRPRTYESIPVDKSTFIEVKHDLYAPSC